MSENSTESPPEIAGLEYASPLGSGGYSEVYLYTQAMPRRNVAVKVLRNTGLTDAIRRQFTAEANAMAALADHPNIVSVITADVSSDGRPYLVMTYYPKDNLAVRSARERFAVSEVLRIGIQIASAVETAHRAGILHRDIKPANILTNQYGTVGLTDFGIAAELIADEDEDDTGVSVPWSPPEVLYATAPASVQSDVYSLGATLWHLLVGRSPFEVTGGDNSAIALMRRSKDSPVPSTGRGDVPASLERLLAQAMAKDPAGRPPSALDLARSLQAVEQELHLPRTEIVVLDEEEDDDSAEDLTDEARPDIEHATRMRSATVVAPHADPGSGSPSETRARPTPTSFAPTGTPNFAAMPPPKFADPPGLNVRPAAEVDARAPEEPTTARPQRPLAAPGRSESVPASRPPSEPRDNPTVRRQAPAVPADAEAVEVQGDSPRARGTLIAIGVVVVVIAAVAGFLLFSGGTKKAPVASQPAASDAVLPDDLGPPGTPTVTGSRIDPSTAHFIWTYTNSAATDTFLWQTPDGSENGTSTAPALDLPAPEGSATCVQVKVVRADGTHAALTWSNPGCVQ